MRNRKRGRDEQDAGEHLTENQLLALAVSLVQLPEFIRTTIPE